MIYWHFQLEIIWFRFNFKPYPKLRPLLPDLPVLINGISFPSPTPQQTTYLDYLKPD